MCIFSMLLSVVLILYSSSSAYTFIDDFNDNDISDWEERIGNASWTVSNGMVNGSISGSPGVLTPLIPQELLNCTVTTSATGSHAFGLIARLTEDNSGIIAYVSPDHNLARIRIVNQGQLGASLNTVYQNFPSGVFYDLTLCTENDELTFNIDVPSTGDSWTFSATDPDPVPGSFGLLMGSEPGAHWDWIEVEGSAEGNTDLTWFTTNDETTGDGDFCLEPGETIQLSCELTNFSDYTLLGTFAILQSLSPELQVTENYVEYGDLPGMSSSYGNSSFSVMASPAAAENEVYNMRLTVMAEGGYLDQVNFSLPVGFGLSTDLESDSFGWSWATAETGWANDWHVSQSRNHTPGGQYSFKCGSTGSGDYSDHHYGYLTTPYFNIPLNGECTFWSWLEAQVMNPSTAFDGGIVQYRRLNEWIDLFPVPSYSHIIASGSTGPFMDAIPVYSGTTDWTQFTLIFPDSLAGPGALRFLFGSDDSGNREGWYIDDFSVYGPGSASSEAWEPVQQSFLEVSQNPFSQAVSFSCPAASSTIEIRDVSGRLVEELVIPGGQGTVSVVWETSRVPSGIYFAGIAESEVEAIKLVKF